MKFDVLLAKSCDELKTSPSIPSYALLHKHLRLVKNAGEAIFEAVGEKVLQQANLGSEIWLERLARVLPIACLCHDIGKANSGFQAMVRGDIHPTAQPIRHELLSALLLIEKGEIQNWVLEQLNDADNFDDAEKLLQCVIAAVGGHHLKLDDEWEKASIAFHKGGCGQIVQTYLTHENLKPLFLEKVTKEICLDLIKDKANSLQDKHIPFKISSKNFRDNHNFKNNPEWWRFTAILKALMMAADVAGSAVSEESNKFGNKISPGDWVKANLAESQFLAAGQMQKVVDASLKENKLRDFQKAVAESKSKVTLVEAGCGSGKTVAAYAWATNHAVGKKLYFCYPTTGTATEGFLGYVAESDVLAELIHSRSSVDFDKMARVKGDEETKKDEETDNRLRIESLRAWFPQVVICTADTVLALPRNNRRGLYNSPSILTASFVFDELHAYDNRMFAAVIALIRALPNAHFLLMTASLPKSRKDFLLKYIGVENIEQVKTPRELEELPRYEFQPKSEQEAIEIVKKAQTEKLKILWVCNTVAKAQEIFDKLKIENLPVQTYHSRFKYEDRKNRHRQVIDGFDREKSASSLIAVTTQVAEMSLDLDADILISEIAPVPSMIQRLGRLNRRINLENRGTLRFAYFLTPEKPSPYEQTELNLSENWLTDLIKLNRPLSQADLADYFQKLPTRDENELNLKALKTNWLDSGWFAVPEPVREPDVSVSVILPEDEKICERNRREIIKKSIPMNYKNEMENWRELKGNLIAPPNTIDYDKERGARWLKK